VAKCSTDEYLQEQEGSSRGALALTDSPAKSETSERAFDRFTVFEAAALEHWQHGSDATRPIVFLPLPLRWTTASAAAVTLLAVAWALLARIPLQVHGTATIIPDQGINTLVAAGHGRLLYQVGGLGPTTLNLQQRQNNQLLERFWLQSTQPQGSPADTHHQLAQLGVAALTAAGGQQLLLPEDLPSPQPVDRHQPADVVHYPAGTMLARVMDTQALQDLKADLLNQRQRRLTGDRRDRIDQLISSLNQTAVFAPEGGFYLLAKFFRNGSLVTKGDELMSYTSQPPALPRVVPVFLDAASAQQVQQGMGVLLTPRGLSRAHHGGIPGRVVEVSMLPLLGDAVVGAAGSRALAATIARTVPAPYLAWIELQQAAPRLCRQAMSRRCYRWSTGRLPPLPVKLGSLADVQITTGQQRPVNLVLPALSRSLGLAPMRP
jgi:HlyD family secretion protein